MECYMARMLPGLALFLLLIAPSSIEAQYARPVEFSRARSEVEGTLLVAVKRPSRVRYAAVGAAVAVATTIGLIAKFGGEGGPGSTFAVIPVVVGAGALGAVAGLVIHAAKY
jgi:hypothetical protein